MFTNEGCWSPTKLCEPCHTAQPWSFINICKYVKVNTEDISCTFITKKIAANFKADGGNREGNSTQRSTQHTQAPDKHWCGLIFMDTCAVVFNPHLNCFEGAHYCMSSGALFRMCWIAEWATCVCQLLPYNHTPSLWSGSCCATSLLVLANNCET